MEERSKRRTTTTTLRDNKTRMGVLFIIKTGSLLAQCCLLSSLVILSSFIIKFGSCGSFSGTSNGPFTQTNQYTAASAGATTTTTLNSQHQLQKCSNGPPLQWRPYLDAASKAHLAPIVVLGLLQDLNLTPIELTTPTNQFQASLLPLNQQQRQQQLAYHPQNINNIGVNIEATFIVTKVLKKSLQTTNLRVAPTIKLIYKVSASLSTTKDLMALINHNNENSTTTTTDLSSNNNNEQQSTTATSQSLLLNNNHLSSNLNQLATQRSQQMAAAATCSLDLSEHELVKKGGKIFKLNQNYVLFLDQDSKFNQQQQQHQQHYHRQTLSPHSMLEVQRAAAFSGDTIRNGGNYQLQHLNAAYRNHLQVGAASPYLTTTATTIHDVSLHPFATHELLTNQTSRALRKILCKDCGKFQWAR